MGKKTKIEVRLKLCPDCNKTKPINEFHKYKKESDGHTTYCANCCNQRARSSYHKDIEHSRKLARLKNDHRKEYQRSWRDKNKNRSRKQNHIWYVANKKRLQKYQKLYKKTQYKTNINYRLRCILRARLYDAITRHKGHNCHDSVIKSPGCSVEFLKQYLESKFQLGMTWDNHGFGKDKWNIDHVKPLSLFDLTNANQFTEACHYTNLQPMWHELNLLKSNKYE